MAKGVVEEEVALRHELWGLDEERGKRSVWRGWRDGGRGDDRIVWKFEVLGRTMSRSLLPKARAEAKKQAERGRVRALQACILCGVDPRIIDEGSPSSPPTRMVAWQFYSQWRRPARMNDRYIIVQPYTATNGAPCGRCCCRLQQT